MSTISQLDRRLRALEDAPGRQADLWRKVEHDIWKAYGDPGEPFVYDESLTPAQHKAAIMAGIQRAYSEGETE